MPGTHGGSSNPAGGVVDAGHLDAFEAVQGAAREMASSSWTVPETAEHALALAVELTGSPLAFLAVFEHEGQERRVFSLARDGSRAPPAQEVERVLASSPDLESPAAADGSTPAALRSSCAQPLHAGGRMLGMIAVARPTGYTALQQRTFALFADHVAAAIAIAQLGGRRKEMVDTLVNLRADLDRSERQRLISDERARSTERVERAHEAAVAALLAVSRHVRGGQGMAAFYRRLTRSIAELVAADKVLFWKLDEEGMLAPIRGGYGADNELLARLSPTACAPDNDDLESRVVYRDLMFRASRTDPNGEFLAVLERLGVHDAVAVPWRAGDQRLGLVAAYDSRRSGGFSREDGWVLEKAGLAAGLVWQLKYAENDLRRTADRLEKVDAARQLLLAKVSTAVETARKRFAGDLHDDALQKLTAAELQLQRLQDPKGDAATLLTEAQSLLAETEDALRRLLFEVRPPALEVPGGFMETLGERIRMLRSLTGAEVEVRLDLPENLSYEDRSMLFRQVTEAIANVEKHAAATQVRVSVEPHDDGIHGIVQDNGRGFVVAEKDRLPGHLGLLALHERALLAGGWNKITSEPGGGTTVEFWLPLSETKV
jgi:signal transduction histidine kinase